MAAASETMTVPQPFQYQGSKRALASVILQQFPAEVQRVVEPFCGSAALSIAAAARGRAKPERFKNAIC